jgi:hypothetical protein
MITINNNDNNINDINNDNNNYYKYIYEWKNLYINYTNKILLR